VKNIWPISGLRKFWDTEGEVAWLYAAAFFQAFAGGTWLVAMPFVIKRLGGSDFDAGLCIGLSSAGYTVALVMCLLGQAWMKYFNAKRMVQLGSGTIAATMAGAYLTIAAASKGYCGNSAILVLIALATIQGFITVIFWPLLVGWLSTDHEGPELNRRLGIFNTCWSLAGVISPCIGGYLVKTNSTLPLMTSTAIAALSFASVSLVHKPQRRADTMKIGRVNANEDGTELLRWQFIWMGRIALLTSFLCTGLVRSQLGLLFKFNLGFSESSYGVTITVMSAAILAALFTAGKTHKWHYVLSIFLAAQAAMLLGILVILNGVGLWHFFLAVGLVGGGQGFLYSSHLYYVLSGAQNRSSRMAIHEITLSIGFLTGSIVGGYLSDSFGRYAPYWFGLTAVVAGLTAQSAILFLRRPGQEHNN